MKSNSKQLPKSEQIQIRVSPHEKKLIKQAAKRANMNMSDWVLKKLLPDQQVRFFELVTLLNDKSNRRYAFASLNDLFTSVTAAELKLITLMPPQVKLNELTENYLAAMIEYAATRKNIIPPTWVSNITPLNTPYFGTDIKSLRLHLLTHSPAAFRNRNIFIDASLGDRI